MVEFQLAKGKTKVLMSATSKEDRSVDPKVQITTNEYEKLRSSIISKRAGMIKVKPLELVLCVLE